MRSSSAQGGYIDDATIIADARIIDLTTLLCVVVKAQSCPPNLCQLQLAPVVGMTGG